ncbi:MAG: peptidoglycan DD-metalloendopeptidase family protein [Candidatus Krumholzibacteria bacterium]|nr:peptidoglycan DD-metalloendopeptidase family protein [Candidatus Krumholzibacteria bacterium]
MRHTTFMRAVVLVPVLLLTASLVQAREPSPLQESIRENTAKLSSLRARIQKKQERMASLENQANSVRRSHVVIQKEIAESQQLMSDMVQSEAMLTTQSQQMALDVDQHRQSYEGQKENLARSLRNMYLRGQRGELEMVMTAGNFSDLMTRMKVSRMMARLEAGMVEKTRTEGVRVQQEQRVLAAALAEIWQAREEKRFENDRLELLMAEQVASLRELENEKNGLKNQMLDLSLNEQKLNYILEDLEQQRTEDSAIEPPTSATSLASLAGNLDWPVHGELIRGFGRSVHPRFKTVTLNNGFNIAAGTGAPVASVAAGTVEFSDHLPGFGQCVILDHGAGYYTLYAHLDRVFVDKGEQIARGQVVAEVGRPSGGEEPQLYFEVRQGRTPLDPGDWLKPR